MYMENGIFVNHRRLSLFCQTSPLYVTHSSAIFQAFSISVGFYCPCDKVYHKHEVRFVLYLIGHIVT